MKIEPEENINSYYDNMLMLGVLDVVICREFYYTLSTRAAEWFKSLEPGLISSFANLARKFVQRFTTSKAVRKHFNYLEKSKQHGEEFLAIFLVK